MPKVFIIEAVQKHYTPVKLYIPKEPGGKPMVEPGKYWYVWCKLCSFVNQKSASLSTITLKINKNTKAGKAFLSLLEFFVKEKKGVEIVKTPNAETLKTFNDTDKGEGLVKVENSQELFKQLGI